MKDKEKLTKALEIIEENCKGLSIPNHKQFKTLVEGFEGICITLRHIIDKLPEDKNER